VRLHERTRISKPQSHQPEALTTSEYIEQSSDDIWDLVQDTRDVANIIRHLTAAFSSGRAKTEPLKAFPQAYRDVWNARRKPHAA
jgi:hypothetical protein